MEVLMCMSIIMIFGFYECCRHNVINKYYAEHPDKDSKYIKRILLEVTSMYILIHCTSTTVKFIDQGIYSFIPDVLTAFVFYILGFVYVSIKLKINPNYYNNRDKITTIGLATIVLECLLYSLMNELASDLFYLVF